MMPLAVVRKDLRLRLRGWRWAGVVTLYVGILGLIAVGFLLHGYGPSSGQSSRVGVQLLQTLAIFQLCLIVFVTPASMAGAISGERQHRTWDLLVLSRLSRLGLVWGKLLVGFSFNLLLIAASLPLFGLVFLFGGVGLTDLIPTFVVFLATVLLLSATSLLVSALTARLTVSYTVGLLISLAFAAGLSLLTVYLQAPNQPSLLTLAGIPFQSFNTPSPLTPLAQLDPLAALLSALPAETGGTVLGDLGTINHAFGLPWQLPLWGTYALLAGLISLLLLLVTAALVRPALPWQRLRRRTLTPTLSSTPFRGEGGYTGISRLETPLSPGEGTGQGGREGV
jgi:ABC-type transport system involved in multi-copper enzyme maturation permease subunit